MSDQTERVEVVEGVDGFAEKEAKRKIEELVRYILTRFLTIAVNTVFKQCCEASEEADGADKPDGEPKGEPLTTVELLIKYSDQLPAIFFSCGKQVACNYVETTKTLFYHVLPHLGLQEQLPEVNLHQIITGCIAEWYVTNFQVALLDLIPSQEIADAVNETTPNVSDVIRVTFWAKYVESLLEHKFKEEWQKKGVRHR